MHPHRVAGAGEAAVAKPAAAATDAAGGAESKKVKITASKFTHMKVCECTWNVCVFATVGPFLNGLLTKAVGLT